jgi:adenylate cyclase
MCVPLWKGDEIIGVIQLNSIKTKNPFTEDDLELLKSIGCQMSMVLEQVSLNEKIREEEKIRNWLSRFHSPQVIDAVLSARTQSEDSLLEAKDQEVTVLFADIIDFTRASEAMSPRDVSRFLNAYYSLMTDIVFENDGTLDKYIGDGVMAVFGAPIAKDDDAERAVRSALKMRRELIPLMKNLTGGESFRIRIGVNTGHAVAGRVGSPRRMDYTVVGDAVNVASRLESIAQPNQILIGEETYRQVGGKFATKEIGSRSLKGKSSDVLVYEVLDDSAEKENQGL